MAESAPSSQPEHPVPEAALSSRRDFLKRAGRLGAVFVIGGTVEHFLHPFGGGESDSGDDPSVAALQRLQELGDRMHAAQYGPGDTIPGPVPVEIPKQGWTLVAHPSEASKYVAGTKLLLHATTPNTLSDPFDRIVKLNNQVLLDDNNIRERGRHGNSKLAWRVRPVTTREYAEDPGLTDEPRADAIRYTLTPLTESVHRHVDIKAPYRIVWFDGHQRHRSLVDPRKHRVVSEMPLDAALHEPLDRTIAYYQTFMRKRSPIAVIAAGSGKKEARPDLSEEVANYVPEEDITNISLPFLGSKFEGTALPHELNHALFSEFKDHPENRHLKTKFENTHARIVNSILQGSNKAANPCSKQYAALLEIFDESTYLDVNCGTGHPGDDADELFASGLNCMQQFTEPLLRRLGQLSEQDQAEARAVVGLIIEITDTLAHDAGVAPMITADSPLRSS